MHRHGRLCHLRFTDRMVKHLNTFQNTLMSCLLADAASLGLNWLYDVERLNKVVKAHNNQPTFLPVDKNHYQDTIPTKATSKPTSAPAVTTPAAALLSAPF